MNLDAQGNPRGSCSNCNDCEEYCKPKEGNNCDYCSCKPTQHIKLPVTSINNVSHFPKYYAIVIIFFNYYLER